MSSFVNYFAPLAHDERMPITQELVKNGTRNRRSIARVARRRAIERQRSEDAQVEQYESLTHNNRDLGRYRTDIYTYEGLALKLSPNVNPTIAILGTLLHRS
jgi:hypothetical protein